jgi:hypothetical protein
MKCCYMLLLLGAIGAARSSPSGYTALQSLWMVWQFTSPHHTCTHVQIVGSANPTGKRPWKEFTSPAQTTAALMASCESEASAASLAGSDACNVCQGTGAACIVWTVVAPLTADRTVEQLELHPLHFRRSHPSAAASP